MAFWIIIQAEIKQIQVEAEIQLEDRSGIHASPN
jgi:hypothetical protein